MDSRYMLRNSQYVFGMLRPLAIIVNTWIQVILKSMALHMLSFTWGTFSKQVEHNTPGTAFGGAPGRCRALGRGIFSK